MITDKQDVFILKATLFDMLVSKNKTALLDSLIILQMMQPPDKKGQKTIDTILDELRKNQNV